MSFTLGDAFIFGGLLNVAETVRHSSKKEYYNANIKESNLTVIPPTLELKKASMKVEGVDPNDALALLCLIACNNRELSTKEAFDLLNTWKPDKLHKYFDWFAEQFNEANTIADILSRSARWQFAPEDKRKRSKSHKRLRRIEERGIDYLDEVERRALNIHKIRERRLRKERFQQDKIFGLPTTLIGVPLAFFIVLGMAYSNKSMDKEQIPVSKVSIQTTVEKSINLRVNPVKVLIEERGEQFDTGNLMNTTYIVSKQWSGFDISLYFYCNQNSGSGYSPNSMPINKSIIPISPGKGGTSITYVQTDKGLTITNTDAEVVLNFPNQSIDCS